MRIFCATLGTETNTFSPISTTLSSFSECHLYRPGEHPETPTEFTAPLWVARQRAVTFGWQVIEGTCAFALPAGVTVGSDYEFLRDEILGQIVAAMPLDAVALCMHGAMVADGYPDCEGDMLQRVREIVGENVAIGVELDPHCHLTSAMTETADAIVIFKEYPHTDFLARAEELLDILDGIVAQKIRPCMSVFDCRMLAMYHTTKEPMKGFLRRLGDLEGSDRILSISIVHGFPWGDVEDIGTRILVISDDDQVEGDRLARNLGIELFGMRGQTSSAHEEMVQAIRKAKESKRGLYVLADTADNPGGGAPGDATYVLREMLRQKVRNACYAAICDPKAVQAAIAAGIGETIPLSIGGKLGPSSGEPLEVIATVTGVCQNSLQSFATSRASLGRSAAVRVSGVDVVLSSLRSQVLGREAFTNVGIELERRRIVALKSSQHFYAAFAPLADEVIYLDSPGALTQDFRSIEYRNRPTNMWPFTEEPFSCTHRNVASN